MEGVREGGGRGIQDGDDEEMRYREGPMEGDLREDRGMGRK